jgi:dihydroxyacetone kinase DhaKLM complex PTS-EIIA-like component DhaM
VAEEDCTPATEESAPLPHAETEAPAVEATLSEASIVEGEYTAQVQSSSKSSRSH